MIRFSFVAAAVAAVALPASASLAQGTGGYYSATPTAAPATNRFVTRSLIWHCGDGVCTAGQGDTRDIVSCQLLAREVGTLSAFTANGETFDAEKLAQCNSRARN